MVAKEKVLKCFHAAAMATGCQVSSFCSVQKYITASGPKRCKSGFVTYRHHVVQQAKLQLVVKYCFWLVIKICL